MFLVRSAFWLTVAFIAIRPDVDIDGAVAGLQQQAVDAGREAIVQHILAPQCDTLDCAGRNALLAGALNSSLSLDSPMQDSSNSPVPFPRPRPDWMG